MNKMLSGDYIQISEFLGTLELNLDEINVFDIVVSAPTSAREEPTQLSP